jgi:hypothetical protein
MTLLSFHDFRRLARLHPDAAAQIWDQGQPIAFAPADCETAVAGMVAADLSGGRLAALVALVGAQVTVPATLMLAIRMVPGWVGATPLIRRAGMALAVLGLAQGFAQARAAGGVMVQNSDGSVTMTRG